MTLSTHCVKSYSWPFWWPGTSSRRYGLTVRGEGPSESQSFLDRLRAGDPEAFEEMVKTYQHRVYGVALRMMRSTAEAEEVAQETFLRAHRALGEFRGDARLSTWLYAISSRLCLNRLASGESRMARHRAEDVADLPGREGGRAGRRSRARRARGRASPGHRRAPRGPADRGDAARPRGPLLRGDRGGAGARARHGALAPASGPRGAQGKAGALSSHDLPGESRAPLGAPRWRARGRRARPRRGPPRRLRGVRPGARRPRPHARDAARVARRPRAAGLRGPRPRGRAADALVRTPRSAHRAAVAREASAARRPRSSLVALGAVYVFQKTPELQQAARYEAPVRRRRVAPRQPAAARRPA